MIANLIRGNEDLQKYTGPLLFENLLACLPIFKDSYLNDGSKRSDCTPASDVLKSICMLQALGKTSFHDIKELNNNAIFTAVIGRTISEETTRQRLNKIALNKSVLKDIDNAVVQLLKKAAFRRVTFYGKSYIPLDIDVTPFCNPGVQKEGIEYTYKGVDGYAPIMAYLGQYALCFDLRPGSQHSECGAIEFLLRCVDMIKKIGLNPEDILVRVDSAHDDADFIKVCEEKHLYYLIKRNPRGASQKRYVHHAINNVGPSVVTEHESFRLYWFLEKNKKPTYAPNSNAYCVFQVTEPFKDKNGILTYGLLRDRDPKSPRFTFGPDVPCTVQSIWTNLPRSAKDEANYGTAFARAGFRLYNDHATSEQYHSELKTDMNMELLPSKYFTTNKLFLALSAIAFNVLRLIGDKAVSVDASLQHHKTKRTERIRLRTVIDKFCTIACRVKSHARQLVLEFGRKCSYFDTFVKLYR